MTKTEIFKILNLRDPYPRVKELNIKPFDGPLWGGKSDIFKSVIDEKNPKIIIELGTFLGNSTITMAKHLKQNNINCVIIAVDTWLGSQEHWITDKCNILHLYKNFEFGISSMYDQFLTNVIAENLEDYIVPMPATTDTAYDVLLYYNIKADIIYMDADHRESVVYNDLLKYENLLKDGGLIFGHDIDWIEVKSAVDKYCKDKEKTYLEIMDSVENKIKFWRIK
jgi:hypothetical protein